MRGFLRTISVALAPVLAAACATAPPARYSVNNARFYPLNREVMWERALAISARNDFYVTSTNKQSGVISLERAIVAPSRTGSVYDWADCGGVSPMERPVSQLAELSLVVQPEESGTLVTVNSQFSELRQDLKRQVRRVNCTSTGAYEYRLLQLLARD